MADEVIKEHPELDWLKDVSIGYVSSDKAKTGNHKNVLAECHLVKDLYKPYIPHDFLIVVYEPNVATLTLSQLKILIEHELMHIGQNDAGDYFIVPHDIEEFRRIIDMYGLDWAS